MVCSLCSDLSSRLQERGNLCGSRNLQLSGGMAGWCLPHWWVKTKPFVRNNALYKHHFFCVSRLPLLPLQTLFCFCCVSLDLTVKINGSGISLPNRPEWYELHASVCWSKVFSVVLFQMWHGNTLWCQDLQAPHSWLEVFYKWLKTLSLFLLSVFVSRL